MSGKRFILLMVVTFVLGAALVVFIQYSSMRNIDRLISGNEALLRELNTANGKDAVLADFTRALDKSGRNAKFWSSVLIALVLVSAAGIFWYIIYRVRQQQKLIVELNNSENRLKAAMEVKENFLANMSHEIRTPMNAILGFTELLSNNAPDRKSAEFIEAIRHSGQHLLTIINDILDVAKIDAGMLRIEHIPFSLQTVTAQVKKLCFEKAEEKHLDLQIHINEDVPDMLQGDPVRLTQILVNLVGNAVKFTEKGRVTLEVSSHQVNAPNIRLGFVIKDTGIGIAADKLPLVFDRFQQGDDAITRRYGGSGLGLSIVKNLVEIQHGEITAQSEAGIGTTIRFTLPFLFSENETHIDETPDSRTINTAISNKKKILVVEDNLLNQQLLEHLLKSHGLSYMIASNGVQALDTLKKQHFELILMDIQMPEMDGYSTSTRIRQQLHLTVPIIAMTARAFPGEREKCIAAGMNDYLAKPINHQELFRVIQRWISGSDQVSDLSYLKEISQGNLAYEKKVIGQFISLTPLALSELREGLEKQDLPRLQKTAHSLKSTVSVMGLNGLLDAALDSFETPGIPVVAYHTTIDTITVICNKALEEAHQLLREYSV